MVKSSILSGNRKSVIPSEFSFLISSPLFIYTVLFAIFSNYLDVRIRTLVKFSKRGDSLQNKTIKRKQSSNHGLLSLLLD